VPNRNIFTKQLHSPHLPSKIYLKKSRKIFKTLQNISLEEILQINAGCKINNELGIANRQLKSRENGFNNPRIRRPTYNYFDLLS